MSKNSTFKLHPQLEKDTLHVTDLALSRVLLMNDSQFPWIILVPRVSNICEIYNLPIEDAKQLNNESLMISQKIMSYFNGDKLNLGALGNLVPQLHIHHIVRFKHDIAWPAPVWGRQKPTPYSKNESERLLVELKELLAD
jgi:diadenosine tetraphosphate (Ap4A) HIT family hydrolase